MVGKRHAKEHESFKMNQNGEQHFNGERPALGSLTVGIGEADFSQLGMEAAYSQLHKATGKKIAKVRFGDDPSKDPRFRASTSS